MPEGGSSYYVNAAAARTIASKITLSTTSLGDVEVRFPIARDRANRSIVGVSMGGIGAVTLALKHPDLFVFAGGISSAIDVPTRAFSLKRMGQYRAHAAIFGSWGSEHRRQNDLFVLARAADSRAASYLVDRVLSRVPDVPPIAGDELPVKEPTRKRRSPLHR